jgi:hypothetical protein
MKRGAGSHPAGSALLPSLARGDHKRPDESGRARHECLRHVRS